MGEVYTSLELGSDSIKIIVTQKMKKSFLTLATACIESKGIKNGLITDTKAAVFSVKRALKQVNDELGVKITKAIVCVAPFVCKMRIFPGIWDVIDYEQITGEDVRGVLKDALNGRINDAEEVVTVIPIDFKVDDKEGIKDPKNMAGKVLETKVVVATLPKEPLYRILEVVKLSGIDTIDIAFTSTGDYYTAKEKNYEKEVGAVINIGKTSTNVSIFNRGIQIKNSMIMMGSKDIDNNLCDYFKIDSDKARTIKETFAVATASYADANDIYETTNLNNNPIEISQVEASTIVEEGLKKILKLSKKEIKNLTNREISYIILTGGLSEVLGFQYLVDEIFGPVAKICNINSMGIRHNKYSSCYGIIKYFDEKLSLRDRTCDMMSKEDKIMLTAKEQKNISNDGIINKVFGHFFDN